MKVFGRYEVIDIMERLVSYGHKASFCLEDNHCDSNVTKHFFCSNVMDIKGKQGGCVNGVFAQAPTLGCEITNQLNRTNQCTVETNFPSVFAEAGLMHKQTESNSHWIDLMITRPILDGAERSNAFK